MNLSKDGDGVNIAPKLNLTDQEVQRRIEVIAHEISLLTAPPHIVNKLVRERQELQWRLWVARYLRAIATGTKKDETLGGFW